MNDCGFTWTTSEKLVPALSLRDKFAMAALTGLLAGNEYDALCRYEKTAELAYQLADAMIGLLSFAAAFYVGWLVTIEHSERGDSK
jgi:hypothetical protein